LLPTLLICATGLAQDKAKREDTAPRAPVLPSQNKDVSASQATPPKDLTPEDREILELLSIVGDYETQAKEYKKEVQYIIERKYNEQQEAVSHSYDRVLGDLEKQKDQERLAAIEIFEKFLAKYPEDPNYTPGALWRLAELHFEKSELEFNQEQDKFQQELSEFNKGQRKTEPVEPAPHYERIIALLQRLIQGFPEFKLNDGAYYLLGYCLKEQGEDNEAQDVWVALVQKFPKTKLLPETWTRLGESYFWDPNRLDKAIEAYLNVLKFPQSQMFEKALYKLAWTYYKVDRFDEAVARFDELIRWADKIAASEPESDGTTMASSDLRKEAMEYLAICFAEDEWKGAGVENAKTYFQKSGGRAYDGEFFRKLGEVFSKAAKFEPSIAAYREAIRRYPLDPENPRLMTTVVESYARLQRFDEATAVEEEMVAAFGPGSKWREANKDNTAAILESEKVTEKALANAAYKHHILAQRYKKEKPEQAQQEYARAALAYAEYLKRFPESKDAYNLTWYLAECYYYSQQFEKAAEHYMKVRDDPASTEYLAESANSVVDSYLQLVKQAETDGKLEPLKIFKSADRPKNLEIKEREIPQLRQRLMAACDVYVEKVPKDEASGNMAFMVAQTLYSFDHFEEARERFARIVSDTKNDALASSSINLIIESYLIAQDWTQVENWSKKLAVMTRDPQLKQNLKVFELGARFNKGNEFMRAGNEAKEKNNLSESEAKYDAAAAEFIRLVDDDPQGKNSDKALNNAALCLTWSNRPVSAGKIYERIVKEYPKSEFADQALFLMASSAENSYQFERAVESYMKLVDGYPSSKYRADALFNAAIDLEGDQQYTKAAKAYERYAMLFKDRPDAAENFFRAGLVLEREKAWKETSALFERFVKTYGKDQNERERQVMARMKMAEAAAALSDNRRARDGYDEIVKLFVRFNLPAGGKAAEAAAKAKFLLAELELKKYETVTFDVPERQLMKTLNLKATTLKAMEEKYKTVFSLKRVQWSLAAYYRLGYLYENFADALTSAPCPKGLNAEECDIYKGKLMDMAEGPIKKAVAAYKDTIEKSKEFKVVNSWTQKALESLNRFEPINFPLQKEGESVLVVERYAAQPLLQVAESGIKPAGK
jgi:cellulose synthase operon protein C